MKHKLNIIIITLSFLVSINMSTSYAQVKISHPRIWLTDDKLAELRIKASVNAIEWQKLLNVADYYIANPTTEWSGGNIFYFGSQNLKHLISCALIYQVLKETDPVTANYYADEALIVMDRFHQSGLPAVKLDSGYSIRNHVSAMAIGYDWLYDYAGLTIGLKTTYYQDLNEWLDWYATDGNGWEWDVAQSNWNVCPSMGLAGIATYGDNPRSQEFINTARSLFDNMKEIYPILGEGGYDGAWNYISYTFTRLLMYMEAVKSAEGEDLYATFPWLKTQLRLKFHRQAPNGTSGYDGGPWSSGGGAGPTYKDAAWFAYIYRGTQEGEKVQYFINDITGIPNDDHWITFLLYDSSAPEEDYTQTQSEPLSWLIKGQGTVFMRSNWEEGAVWAAFHVGPSVYDSTTSSYDKDAGHFEIFKNNMLVVDAGMFGEDGVSRFLFETNYHNTFIFDGIEAYTGSYAPGQSYHLPSDTGLVGIDKFEDRDDYVYSSGDFSIKYRGAVPTMIRSFVFLRPDYFVIFDRVSTLQATFTKHWLLNMVAEPDINGDTITELYKQGKLFVKQLLPQNATISKQYLDNVALWQIQETPNEAKQNDLFLNVLYPCDSSISSMPETVKIDATSGNMVGAHIAANGSNPNWVVMFGGAESDVKNVDFDVSGIGAIKILLCDIEPYYKYNIWKNGQFLFNVASTSQGTLYFETTLGSPDSFKIQQGEYVPPSGGGGGGGCLIATAVYGSPMAKEEQILRKFRDKYLLTNELGKRFVEFYYKVSPPVARFVEKRERMRCLVRGMLKPVVWIAKKAVEK